MTFKDRGKGIVSPEIILFILDVMRAERKTDMVLSDKNIDKYISQEIAGIDLYDKEQVEKQPLDI